MFSRYLPNKSLGSMVKMSKGRAEILVSYLILFGLFIISCSSDGKKRDKVEVDMNTLSHDSVAIEGIKAAKQIFYSLPSPLETAMILKRAGAKYNEEILNSVDNTSRYSTNRSMALNLGIYSTDLSYSSLFDQTQASIKFMTASKKMAEGLGILNAIDNSVIQKLEENVNNRDVILDIISETLLNTNSNLEENDRVAIGSIILVGGWVEGLYIATTLVEDFKSTDNELVERIIDQKLSLNTVINLLNQNKDNPDIKAVMEDINAIKLIYEQVQISVSGVQAIPDKKSGVTTLRSKNVSSVSPEVFSKLKSKVSEIRNKYIL
jgi:putative ubiquitin-RnfH superfamily antitoxin RatB of RatAB toxin-antitoxin module